MDSNQTPVKNPESAPEIVLDPMSAAALKLYRSMDDRGQAVLLALARRMLAAQQAAPAADPDREGAD